MCPWLSPSCANQRPVTLCPQLGLCDPGHIGAASCLWWSSRSFLIAFKILADLLAVSAVSSGVAISTSLSSGDFSFAVHGAHTFEYLCATWDHIVVLHRPTVKHFTKFELCCSRSLEIGAIPLFVCVPFSISNPGSPSFWVLNPYRV
jgi:hypothetical protein